LAIQEIEKAIEKMIADLQGDFTLAAKLKLEALDRLQEQIKVAKQQVKEDLERGQA
jgi:hypothetical protein